ncbi:Protein of unknown function DUF3661, vaculolar transmembrane domain-containing protein [Rozella allomycis CSF55]|uniref:Uncharacterized protein n=1 Tax=Rozella allomycis (strain CSF55) TaxID=988480 RepID=A0A075AYY6_ROZAC|nr:Protein of unknown function DUF3661, vaculolar transmembrane domain-containing protein [Rozella allomycis CSF55]|eukprot:EPZ35515.1 Protein of unknown function DUF3661, vaculolar transmembrane domain-containing protein [Rozella allomycis CSF55]
MLQSGFYGQPVKIRYWLAQTILFVVALLINKSLLFPIIGLDVVYIAGALILSPIQAYPKWELLIVMLIVPFIMNVFQFWVIDQFIKDPMHSLQVQGYKAMGDSAEENYIYSHSSTFSSAESNDQERT